eukprot:m.106656 g.106656  ORF g.106656 m.106656 type:complete len:56 (-) comp27742_c1_seq1:89-256(-)
MKKQEDKRRGKNKAKRDAIGFSKESIAPLKQQQQHHNRHDHTHTPTHVPSADPRI